MNSYDNRGFLMELDPDCWSASIGVGEKDVDKISAILHEYIHFLQDTTTYYGAILRNAKFHPESSNADNPSIVGGLLTDIVNVLGAQYQHTPNGVYYGNVLIGSRLIKESMATLAQKYALLGVASNIPKGQDYNLIEFYIDDVLPCLKQKRLLHFVICDVCLMCADPGFAFGALVQHLMNDVNLTQFVQSDIQEKLAEQFYDLCETYLIGIITEHPITRNWLSEDHWLVDAYRGTGLIEIDKGVQLKDNPDIFEKVLTQLQKQYIENFAEHREKCHSTITQILMVFARQRDIGLFYNVYGMPIMKTVMPDGTILTNVSQF